MAPADFSQRPAVMIVKPLLVALQFLTRVPVPPLREIAPRDSGRSMLFYPLVGAVIGLMLFAVEQLLHDAAPLLRAVILLTLWVAITGALHLDGLADMVDGWIGGHGDRERTLAIMKDPYCGPMGVTALLLVLLLKVSALEQVAGYGAYTLILAPLLGRIFLLLLFLTTPYVRAAPQNAKRLNRKTPCVETGVCADCNSPDRICNIYVSLAKKPVRTEVVVILVGENLGI